MKARITWLVEGDRNTFFFHTSALVRRRRNRISCIKDRARNWIHGERDIADFLRLGFIELFSSSHSYSTFSPKDPHFWQACIREEMLLRLLALFLMRKLRSVFGP